MAAAKAFDTVGNFWDQHARTELSEDDFDDIRNLAIQAQVAALSEVGHGLVYEIDPRGLEPLKRSLFLRREMRELRKDMSWLSIINRIQESRSRIQISGRIGCLVMRPVLLPQFQQN